jgi:hypothetical protein
MKDATKSGCQMCVMAGKKPTYWTGCYVYALRSVCVTWETSLVNSPKLHKNCIHNIVARLPYWQVIRYGTNQNGCPQRYLTSGAGFTTLDYELFVQKSAAATNSTVQSAKTKQTYIFNIYRRGSKSV